MDGEEKNYIVMVRLTTKLVLSNGKIFPTKCNYNKNI